MTNQNDSDYQIRLTSLLSADTLGLLTTSGKDLIKRIGIDVIRGVVLDVLTGRNIRNSTEILTRRRIAALNLATFQLFLQGSKDIDNFIERLPYIASEILSARRLKKEERWLSQWILGLTEKGVQNILRDNYQLLAEYRDSYIDTCREVVAQQSLDYGELSGDIHIGTELQININWLFMTYLLNTIGSQTLTIRGSDKSTYGKLFEKLVLGSLLHVMGFEFQKSGELENMTHVFWLSSNDDDRESDATLLYEAGKGVRFDIGFIGRGNTEISLDKVSRYNREIQLGRENWFMATMIVVDRIGEGSRIQELANKIDGTIVQMSAGYWPQRVARTLKQVLGFEHPLVTMEQSEVGDFLKEQMHDVPLEAFIGLTD
ncbi:MAG: CfrBI family restriction endonuclease [Anaerolineaceae bacterium]|nr:CfrBI family restriction endonuclease [Anaerolineaceae bacterium]